MLFKIMVLIMLMAEIALQVCTLLRTGGKVRGNEPQEKQSIEPTEATRAEKMFSEGVLNVLNYSNPMERGSGE